jgi:sarcosine oxidase subunit beta
MATAGRGGYDAVVVGGGNLGLWTAYGLAERGLGRVAVCERGWAGWGATSRSSGMIRQQGGTVAAIVLGRLSRQAYLRLGEALGLDSGYVETGYFVVAASDKEAELFQGHVGLRLYHGVESVWLEPGEARQRFPQLDWDRYAGATYCPTDGYVHPPLVARNITFGVVRAGVEVLERCEVLGIEPTSAGYRLETTRGAFASGIVVDAGGPRGAKQVAALLDVAVPVAATRHQVVSYATVDGIASPFPMAFVVAEGWYVRPEEQGAVVGVSNPAERADASGRYQLGFDWDFHERMRPVWEAAFSPVAGQPISRTWAASIDYTPDHLPILDQPRPGFFVVAAGGHGMMCGPGLGLKAAELVATGNVSELPAEEIGLDRFRSGAAVPPKDQIALPFPTEA